VVGEEMVWPWDLPEILTRAFSEEEIATYSVPLLLTVEVSKPLEKTWMYMLTAQEHESTRKLWWKYTLVGVVQRIGEG